MVEDVSIPTIDTDEVLPKATLNKNKLDTLDEENSV
jgi:hypothetical protein